VAILVIPWYVSECPRHNSEIMLALFHNLTAPGVDRVVVVSEQGAPSIQHPRLEFVSAPARPSFWDLFEVVRDQGPFAVANADCAVVDLRLVDKLRGDAAFWTTRWDVYPGRPVGDRYRLSWGADLFAFAGAPDLLERGPWAPGEVYCDRAIGRAMVEAGYQVSNPSWGVPVLHFHASRVRSEDARRASSGIYKAFSVRPTELPRSPIWSEPFVEKVP
jgi:hypothetical protein